MSIPDFDVEPVVGPRSWAVVLGVVGAVAGVLAVIGWPLPVVAGRGGDDGEAWRRTIGDVDAWSAHDGWRFSGSSWVFGAAAVAALLGVVVLLHPDWGSARRWSVVVGPAGGLLLVGPAAQGVLGLPWSNYGSGTTDGTAVAVGIAVAAVGTAAIAALRRAVRRSARPDDGRNPPP
ncbi:hypothetical protein [Curtobacterium luteum]|uniref:hypothetical protein n=1 Tax=Curtobacterium luteum TaxID=33881 RepID=UPI00381A5576